MARDLEVFDDIAYVHVHAEGARSIEDHMAPGLRPAERLTQAGLVQERHVLAQLEVPRAGLAALAFLIAEAHEGALVVVEQDAHHTHRQTDADAVSKSVKTMANTVTTKGTN